VIIDNRLVTDEDLTPYLYDFLEMGPAQLSPQRRDNRLIRKHLGKTDHVVQVFGRKTVESFSRSNWDSNRPGRERRCTAPAKSGGGSK
jgi:hypothetical protein